MKTDECTYLQQVRRARLTDAQKQLWIIAQQSDNGSRAYNFSLALRLRGALDVEIMEQAIQDTVGRHDALRTTITPDGQEQEILECNHVDISVVDLSCWGSQEQAGVVAKHLESAANELFDLTRGPLFRARIIRLEPEHHVLALTGHHIVVDGWAMGILLEDIAGAYAARRQGSALQKSLPLQHSEYVVWFNDRLGDVAMLKHEAYWLEHLASPPAALELPTDYPRPATITYDGGRYSTKLDVHAVKRLRQFSQRNGSSLFMTLLAGYTTLLHRLSAQDDIVVGIPVAGRSQHGAAELVSYCVNLVPIRSCVTAGDTFVESLVALRGTLLDAYDHADYPFSSLVNKLKLPREPSRRLLVEAVFNLGPVVGGREMPGFEIEYLRSMTHFYAFDIGLNIASVGEELLLDWEYNTDLFDAATIARWAKHFVTLLENAVQASQTRVSALPLLTAAEREQLVADWCTTRKFAREKCIHQLFEHQVEKTPENIAVVSDGQALSYAELNARANQLAHRLCSLGVGPEVRVGLCLERSPELVVGILGILKAGGAYVPLDPECPAERLAFMLEDARVPVLLTQQALVDRFAVRNTKTLCVDANPSDMEAASTMNLECCVLPDNVAYVIYTSGTTGKPKGCLVTHYNALRLFDATRESFGFTSSDVWTLFHSAAFDFSVWEVWGALLHGGRLVVVPYWVSRTPESFYDLLCREGVTVLNQTPSAFRELMAFESAGGASGELRLRNVIFGGEALDSTMLRPWFELHGDSVELVNMYGITETTVHVTHHVVRPGDVAVGTGSRIGRPLLDLQVRLLDANGQLVPIGVPGELYVGGAGVARGYLDRPDLTAERFVPDPFSVEPGARMYRTGDLGRWLVDGSLEYLGRADRQVKIRGFRVELGEIESALGAIEQVSRCVVVARKQTDDGQKHLVAYVVAAGKGPVMTTELRRALSQFLPDYMVPSVFVVLEELPLTPNGKVDHRALPAPDLQRPELDSDLVPPRNADERLLVEIWADVLGVANVGIRDNFFELGGDSLLSMQVLARAKQSGLEFSLRHLFLHPTIEELLATNRPSGESRILRATAPLSLIDEMQRQSLPDDVEDAYPLTQLQAGMLFHSEYAPEMPIYHDVTSYHLRVPLDLQVLQSAIDQVVHRHPVLRTSFVKNSLGESLQLVHVHIRAVMTVEDISSLSADEQEVAVVNWIEGEKRNSFNLQEAPLLRFHLLQRGDSFNFAVSNHHAILDGWSVATLNTELFQLYLHLLGRSDRSFPPMPGVSFRDYVANEQQILISNDSREYWRHTLSDCVYVELPRRPDGGQRHPSTNTEQQPVKVSPLVGDGLRSLAKAAGLPLKSVLLAAHVRVMSLLSGQKEVVTGVVTHGRPPVEGAERVLGLFLNTTPLRLKMTGGTWTDLVRAVFEKEREILPYQDYPLAEIQRDIGRGRRLFETAFNFVKFHVYASLADIDELEVLGGHSFWKTNFTLLAQASVNPLTNDVEVCLAYDSAELDEAQVERIAGYYQTVLEAMAFEPKSQCDKNCILSEAELHQLLVEWNVTDTRYPDDQCIHQLFEAQVKKTPEAIAVVCKDQSLSYAELNVRANRLARHLVSLGVKPGEAVALMLERSTELVAAELAILKVGAIYVPLDSSFPTERLVFMLEDCGAKVLFTSEGTRFAGLVGVASVDIARLNLTGPTDDVWVPGSSEAAAYIMYTSGSTGEPKGVIVPHRAVIRLVINNGYADFRATDRVAFAANPAFDATTMEVWAPLLNGGCTVIIDQEELLNPQRFGRVLRRHEVNVLWMTVGLFNRYADELGGEIGRLRYLFVGGDALDPRVIARVLQRERPEHLINGYGPTETTTFAVTHEIRDVPEGAASIPIGRPIANTKAYILDAHRQPVPVGVVGELYIGGAGVAHGYLGRPELTTERFILDPFSTKPDARMYKTGDLVRWLPDGTIEFLGRNDSQVKIRGFRVELGEIEAVLLDYPEVREAVVIAQVAVSGDKRLVAYFVSGVELSIETLRTHLSGRLPGYMVPAAFVQMDALPLNRNGKVDRRALPAPEGRMELAREYVPPRTPTETMLADIWAAVLGVARVGVDDNFFELGGHSLLATQVVSRISHRLQVDIPLRYLFENATIGGVATLIDERLCEQTESKTPEIKAVSRRAHRAILTSDGQLSTTLPEPVDSGWNQ